MIRKLSILILAIFISISSYALAAAPVIYIQAPPKASLGSKISVKIAIDSPIPLNAYEVEYSYSNKLLKLIDFDNSRSVIDLWQDQPQVDISGGIKLKGGSFNPFKGQNGEIISMNFEAIATGTANIEFSIANVFLADGLGTKIKTALQKKTVAIISEAVLGSEFPEEIPPKDINPPEINFLSIINDPFNPNQKLLSFLTKDKGSGVKETIAREKTWFLWSDWKKVINPQPINAEVWSIDFRVVDNAGNISQRSIRNWGQFLKNLMLPLMVALVLLGIIAAYKLRNKFRK